MKYPFIKGIKTNFSLLFVFSLLALLACKKELMVEQTVDAFAKLDAEINYDGETYSILFSLQKYPYKMVGIRISNNKSDFNSRDQMPKQIANPVADNRYGFFVNNLLPGTTYYYQIFVQDSAGNKEVNSDLLSFKTQP